MSRCLPYPPPGYLRNGERGEAVSESIKIQKDWKEAVTELDLKKKKEKREKKKSRKVKKDACSLATCAQPEKILPKGKEEEAERSSLTEEHGQPVCSQSLCYSSDSSRSSKKRKGDDSVYNPTKTHGNIFRIRLPLQRHREPNASSNMEQLCSTSGRTDSLSEQKRIITISRQEPCSTINSKSVELISAAIKPTSSVDLARKEESARPSSKTDKKEQKLKKAELQFEALFEDWVPPPLYYEQNNLDDQEWLYDMKQQEQHAEKRIKISHDDEPCTGGGALWPCARFLPKADIYALPYTIPF